MEKSEVFFTDMHTRPGYNLLDKLEKVIKRAGIEQIDFNHKFVAVKIHFGERGNLSFLRPNFAQRLVDTIKPLGGYPFLTDCNTLYVGYRKNALDHLETAYENGFSPISVGCQILIGDGLKGTDESIIPLTGTTYVTEAKIGHVIADADIIISLNHFKGHELTGFGGAIKNLGMGCASRAGKMEQHCSGKPDVDLKKCVKCHQCIKACAHGAISYDDQGYAHINHEKCVGCGRCLGTCNFDAIFNPNFHANDELCMKMAEYAKAAVLNKPNFHINIITQVSPFCDCHGENDVPIIPDVGIMASFDPVALDKASADMCNRQSVIPGSLLDRHLHQGADIYHDHFTNTSPDTNWKVCLEHAQKMGLGHMDYDLITVK